MTIILEIEVEVESDLVSYTKASQDEEGGWEVGDLSIMYNEKPIDLTDEDYEKCMALFIEGQGE